MDFDSEHIFEIVEIVFWNEKRQKMYSMWEYSISHRIMR